jgi:hypothetical protein
VADQTGCCCNFSRQVVAAKDVSSWITEKQLTCGGSYCCCPGQARVEIRPSGGYSSGTIHVRVGASDADPTGPINTALRTAINADKQTPIIVNDVVRSYSASTCVCLFFDVSNRLSLGGLGAYDVIATRTESGCFQLFHRTDASQVPDVDYTRYTNSLGMCACIQSNLGACHCGEQLELGLRDRHTITVATNKGQAKEAVAELYRRNRHPMMPEPQVVRTIKGTTICCGPESELTLGTESITLAKYRFPTGCFPCSPCQAADNITMTMDDVRIVTVSEESPCANAAQAAKHVPESLMRAIQSILIFNLFGFFGNLISFAMGIPLIMYEAVMGVICLPCRRSFVVVDGPADLAFRVRPPLDTGRSISDFAVELHQQIRDLKAARAGMLASILSGAGKDTVLFAAVGPASPRTDWAPSASAETPKAV